MLQIELLQIWNQARRIAQAATWRAESTTCLENCENILKILEIMFENKYLKHIVGALVILNALDQDSRAWVRT